MEKQNRITTKGVDWMAWFKKQMRGKPNFQIFWFKRILYDIPMINIIIDLVKPPAKILEAGCGSAGVSILFFKFTWVQCNCN